MALCDDLLLRRAGGDVSAECYRQLQRGRRSAEGLTQRATFGAEQVTSQLRFRRFTLQDVVPITVSPISLLLVVLVDTLVWLASVVLTLL